MNPEIKTKWVAALRSGYYIQGTGVLRSQGNKFCCLGVLCDIIDPSKWMRGSASCYSYNSHNDPKEGGIPQGLREELGISKAQSGQLIVMNDTKKNLFDEIATYIEENL